MKREAPTHRLTILEEQMAALQEPEVPTIEDLLVTIEQLEWVIRRQREELDATKAALEVAEAAAR